MKRIKALLAAYQLPIKVIGTILLLYWLLRDTDIAAIWNAISQAKIGWILVALLMNFVGMLIVSLRWNLLLQARNIQIAVKKLYLSCIVAMFFNNFLPSTIGGDSTRAYDSWHAGAEKSDAVAVVLLDRLLGILTLIGVASVGLLILYSDQIWENAPFEQFGMLGLGAAIIIGLLGTLLLLSTGFLASVSNALAQMPLFSKGERLIASLASFLRQPKVLVQALFLSLVLQMNVIAHYFVIGAALQISVPFIYFCLAIPVIIVILMMPISINGIGVRENAFALLLTSQGVADADAIALAWIAYGLILFQGIIGGLVYAARR